MDYNQYLQSLLLSAPANNNSNNLVNNGTVNNIIYINKTGSENVLELNESEINEIFNKERAKLKNNFVPTILILILILRNLIIFQLLIVIQNKNLIYVINYYMGGH